MSAYTTQQSYRRVGQVLAELATRDGTTAYGWSVKPDVIGGYLAQAYVGGRYWVVRSRTLDGAVRRLWWSVDAGRVAA